jgi:hypothetical protein
MESNTNIEHSLLWISCMICLLEIEENHTINPNEYSWINVGVIENKNLIIKCQRHEIVIKTFELSKKEKRRHSLISCKNCGHN